jgi:hypothetical protein
MGQLSRETTVVSAAVLFLLAGCSSQKIKTQPVAGKVELAGGDVAILTGSTIEFKSDADETVRPTGNMDSAGNFTMKTLYQGDIVPGAPEGKYKARIILGDESDEGVPKRKGNPVHRRFLEFDTSGLTFSVPSADYTVKLSAK